MNKDWWVPVIQWTLWGVAMAVVMGWLAKSRMKPRPEGEARTLRHPKGILILGVAGFVFFAALVVISNTIGKNETSNIWTTLIFLFFTGLSLALIAEYFRSRHSLSPEGIEYGRLLGPGGRARWDEIRSVTYSPSLQWFVLRTEGGGAIRISAMLMGLPEFARHILKHVPRDRIDPAAEEVLLASAQGNPPSVWRV